MAQIYTCVKLLAMYAILSIAIADEVQKQNGDTRIESTEPLNVKAEDADDQSDNSFVDMRGDHWISCDYTTTPIFSCLDCHSRLICKPYGGKVKHCGLKYCRDGFCSAIPNGECA